MDQQDTKADATEHHRELQPNWLEILQAAFDGFKMPDRNIEELYDHFERMP